MPKVVDHEQRRREVATAAAHCIAVHGYEATTVRKVARIVGYSTTVVSHYFADKRELLEFTYLGSATRAIARVQTALAENPGDVRGACHALLPTDQESSADWRVWFAYWSAATADEALAAEQRRRVIEVREVLEKALLADKQVTGEYAEARARTLLTVLMGIAAQAVFDPSDWPTERMRAEIDAVL